MNIKDFLDFIDFIKNVEKYEARVQVLKDENDRLETNIKLTSEVADIPRTKQLTEDLYASAKKELADAKEQAVDIKEKAKTVFDKRLAELTSREKAAEEKYQIATSTLKEAQELNSQLNATLQKQLQEFEARQLKLQETQFEVDTRLAKLKSVME